MYVHVCVCVCVCVCVSERERGRCLRYKSLIVGAGKRKGGRNYTPVMQLDNNLSQEERTYSINR